MRVESFYDMDYESLKNYLLYAKDDIKKEILKDKKIKEKIIHSPNRHAFNHFAQEAKDDLFLLLLDNEGINILKETDDFVDKMNGILTSGNDYVNSLLEKDSFATLCLDRFSKLHDYFYGIDSNGALSLFRNAKKQTSFPFSDLLCSFNEKSQLAVVKEEELPFETISPFLIKGHKEAVSYLIQNNCNEITLAEYDYSQLLTLFNKGISFPKELLLLDDKFLKKITTMPQVSDYRFLMIALEKDNDIEQIEKARKHYYEEEFKHYNSELDMLNAYQKIYQQCCICIQQEEGPSLLFPEIKAELFSFIGDRKKEYDFYDNIITYVNDKNIEELKTFFQKQSQLQLTNEIIDYHFEEIYTNILYDIKELVSFEQKGGNCLSDEKLQLYQTLLNLDNLSYQEKMEFHQSLKEKNRKEEFYDDIRMAKNKSLNMIKDKMLTSSKMNSFYNKFLSSKWEVPVYLLEETPFYALVKSLPVSKDHILTENDLRCYTDGSSYSLDASTKLQTFKDPKDYYNLLYQDFEIDQVVHVFFVDSFSNYRRDQEQKATNRIYSLETPEDLVKKSPHYNEIVFSQKNERRNDELNETLINPKVFSLYCYDEVTENDLISARNLQLPITLVKTKTYQRKTNENATSMFNTILDTKGDNDYSYIDQPGMDTMKHRKK